MVDGTSSANFQGGLFGGTDAISITAKNNYTGHATYKLKTGGKSGKGQRKLYRIYAYATIDLPPDAEIPLYFDGLAWNAGDQPSWFQYITPDLVWGSPIPASAIAVGTYGLQLTNGYAYAVVANGDIVDITPSVNTQENYDFNVRQVVQVQSKADWQQVVNDEINGDSHVAIQNYNPGNGFTNNVANVAAIYDFYPKLYAENPNQFVWAGMARLAGSPVYAALSDAEYGREGLYNSALVNILVDGDFPIENLASLATEFQADIMGMQINVYQDIAWQYEAYLKAGLGALVAANSINPGAANLNNWQAIDSGSILAGNTGNLYREQDSVLPPGYTRLNNLFPGTSSLMSLLAQNPVIGGPSFSSLEPGANLGEFSARWDWITRPYTSLVNTGMQPLWLKESQNQRQQDVSTPLRSRAQQFSTVYELAGWPLF